MKIMRKRTYLLSCIILALLVVISLEFTFGHNSSVSLAENQSIYTFTKTSDTDCSVRLKDKTAMTAIVPQTATIDGKEYTVTSVAANGFASSSALEKVRLPKTVKNIGNAAFTNCQKLSTLTMPSVEVIGTNAFAMCSKLKYLIIPETTISIGGTILRNSANTKVYLRGSEQSTQSWASNWNIITGSTRAEVEYESEFIPPIEYKLIDAATYRGGISTLDATPDGYWIVDSAQPFQSKDGYDVYIPAIHYDEETAQSYPVIGIANSAFFFNDIKTLTIGYSTEPINIQSFAFYGMNGNSIIINRDVTLNDLDYDGNPAVSNNVFAYSTVSTIVLPDTISKIGANMFDSCTELQDVHFKAAQSGLSEEEEKAIPINLESTRNIELPTTVDTIEGNAFNALSNIKSIYIPNSVKTVGVSILGGWEKTSDGLRQSVIIDYEKEQDAIDSGWNPLWKENCAVDIIEFQGEYVIEYYLYGGTHLENPKTYTGKDTITFNAPVKEGYTFGGWYTNADFTGEPVTGIDKGSSGDKEFHAKWTANTYTVVYNTNKPSITTNAVTGVTAQTVHTYDSDSRINTNGYKLLGWNFIGWNSMADGSGVDYIDGAAVKNLSAVQGDRVTLYAQWEQIEYQVRFIANKPSYATELLVGAMDAISCKYEEYKQLPYNTYQLKGWRFNGWTTSESGGYGYDDMGYIKKLPSYNEETVINLYANWTENIYYIQYDKNKPENASGELIGYMNNTTVIYESASELYGYKYRLAGWEFTGWNTRPDGTGVGYENKQSIYKLSAVNESIITIFAQWKPISYKIHYNANPLVGFEATGNMDDSVFQYDSDAFLPYNSFKIIGATFRYWNTKQNGTGVTYYNLASVKNITTYYQTIELYAIWKQNEYSIIYDSNKPKEASAEIVGNTLRSNHTYGVNARLNLNGYSLTGWLFKGWSTDKNGHGSSYSDGQDVLNLTELENEQITLYAKWWAIGYTIQYEANAPIGTSVKGQMEPTVHYYDRPQSLSTIGYNIEHYKFKGWNTKVDGSGAFFDDCYNVLNWTTDDSLTFILYAQWDYKIYNITYIQNKPESSTDNAPLQVSQNIIYYLEAYIDVQQRFTVTGWEFKCWNTMSDGSGNSYYPGGHYNYLGDIGEAVFLYAQWEVITYYINYNFGAGEPLSMDDYPESYTYDSPDIKIPGAYRKFYDDEKNIDVIPHHSIGNVTITYEYKIRTYIIYIYTFGLDIHPSWTYVVEYEQDFVISVPNYENKTFQYYRWGHIGATPGGPLGDIYSYDQTITVRNLADEGKWMFDSNSATLTANYEDDPHCIATGTLITLSDGRQVPVEQLQGDEELLVWNLQTGKFDTAPILFIDSEPSKEYQIIRLQFSDGTEVKIIDEHAFWDFDLNRYVFLREDAACYIGHYFNKQIVDESGSFIWTRVQLTDVTLEIEYTEAWSPVTYSFLCYYVNGMLSAPGATTGLINIFEVDCETMKYDQAAYEYDVIKYGLFTYEEFSGIFRISEAAFNAFNGQYLKVSIGKGLIDIEKLGKLIERYLNLLP